LQIGEAEIRAIPSTQQDYHIRKQYCITQQHRIKGQEIAEFEAALRKWANGCPLCRVQGMHKQQHRLEDCQEAEIAAVSQAIQTMTQAM
jgi:hypothetical protein